MDLSHSSTPTHTDETDVRDTDGAFPNRTVERDGWWAARGVNLYLLVGGAYLLVSLLIWSHVWIGHPTSITTCGCGDSSASIWYTSWPAFALSHGSNPLYSTAVGYPTGVNLIFASYGIVLAPVTWLFGPIAALNVTLTLSPVLSAVAMFALVRRWVSWTPAAFVAGLFYGFSPFVLANLTVAHVDFGMVAIPPLVVIALDELLIRQRRRPAVTGAVLGVLIGLQFLVGTEVLILTVIEVAIGCIFVIVSNTKQRPLVDRETGARAVVGLSVAAITSLALLAYPVWFAFAGPAHFSGSIHPGLKLSTLEASGRAFLIPTQASVSVFFRILGGYQGSVFSEEYFGIGVILVCLGGLAIWRKDRLLWLFGILSLVAFVFATSSGFILAGVPLLKNIVPSHFVLFAYLTVAVTLGIVVDRTRTKVRDHWIDDSTRTSTDEASNLARRLGRWIGALAGFAVAGLAVVPPAVYLGKSIPITVEPVVLPTWFQNVAPHLKGHPIVLALPAPFTATTPGLTWRAPNGQSYLLAISGKQSAMTWQALGGQHYSIVGPGGLGAGVRHRAGEDQGQNIITQVTFAYASKPAVTSDDIVAVHRALSEWGVTTVVLPDQRALPSYEQVASVTDMAALIAAATGARPAHIADAWVWHGVDRDLPRSYPDSAQYARCTAGLAGSGISAVDRTTSCVLSS